MPDKCPYLTLDEFNDEYICKASNPPKHLPPHLAKICLTNLHKSCPDFKSHPSN